MITIYDPTNPPRSTGNRLRWAVSTMNARPADIPGLWWVDGYPELTTGQLLQIAEQTRGRS